MVQRLKIALIWAYPQNYLSDLYSRHPGLDAKSYNSQQDTIIQDYFSWPPSVILRMKEQGHDARVFMINSAAVQGAWAREHSVPFPPSGWDCSVSLEQLRRFRPDVIWIGSMFKYYGDYLRSEERRVGEECR